MVRRHKAWSSGSNLVDIPTVARSPRQATICTRGGRTAQFDTSVSDVKAGLALPSAPAADQIAPACLRAAIRFHNADFRAAHGFSSAK